MHKKLIKLITTQFLFVLILISSAFLPSEVFASELIGTHLGEGDDIATQINIVTNVLVPNGLEPGSPVTVMVPAALFSGAQKENVQGLADAIKTAGYFPIVRIDGVCEDFTSFSGLNAEQTAQTAIDMFGPTGLIVWGNEINNKQDWCKNWQKYADDFESLRGKPYISPAALDYYMGLDAYKVETMFEEVQEMETIFDTIFPRAANAYGCIGNTRTDCDPLSTTTHQTAYQDINGTLFLTEFSLSPENNALEAPDIDLQKVLDYISNRSGETGAVRITPLVRNTCDNNSEWLLYINGKLFSPQGEEIDIESCEGRTAGSNYNLNIYPSYDADETKFYISPLINLLGDRTVDKLREELALQGYQAYCATENVKVEPQYDSSDKIKKYLEQYSAPKILELDAVETLNLTNATYPLWRDVSNKQFLLTSLEEYFGFRDVYSANPSQAEIMSSPINSLLTEPQLCLQGWRNLLAQKAACERLDKPNECELYNRKIPNSEISFDPGVGPEGGTNDPNPLPSETEFTVKTLLDELRAFDDAHTDISDPVNGCRELTTTYRDEYRNLLNGLINTPTYFDRAYRYGFLVAAVHSLEPGTGSGNIATKIFNFFTQSTRNLQPKDEVLVAAFKIPDIGTNKGPATTTGSQFWSDPLDLTRKILSTQKQNEAHEQTDRVNARNTVLDKATAASDQSSGSKIYCTEGNTATPSCRNELTKALVDIINGTAAGCGEVEAVTVIKDLAGIGDPLDKTGKVFTSNNGGEVLLNLFLDDATHPNAGSGNSQQKDPQIAQSDPSELLKSLFTISDSTWPPSENQTSVDFYLVYPVGFELDAVETAMKSAFFTKAQLAAIEAQNTIGRFESSGQQITLDSDGVGFEYIDIDKNPNVDCEKLDPKVIGQQEYNKLCGDTVSVNINVRQDAPTYGVLGAKLGFWLRKIQLQLNSRVSDAWTYFDTCKTTEQFLLGQCIDTTTSGGAGGPKPGTGGELSCEELRAKNVTGEIGSEKLPSSLAEVEKIVCKVAKGNSNDAQLVWGMMQVDGSPFLRAIRTGATSMSCADILINSCGASQIAGVLIPQCIDKTACPQAGYIADNTSDPWVQEARNNPDVACNIETQLDYLLRKRKSEISWLEGQYRSANNGASPSTQQLYYMMAARNYGLQPAIFTKPACEGAPEVQGCGGSNYCECVMDVFPFSCN